MIEGVDYAWSRPNIGQLAAAGKRFACRYGGPGSSGKQLDPGEAQALSAAGIAIVANAEGAADGLLGGFSVGVSWARDADQHFRACGMPPGRPIYLSVDFDVQSGQWPPVANALRGAASVLGAGRVGVYGGRRAIEWARRDGVAQWFWQTYAWSSGVWVPGSHIQQYANGVNFGGATIDLDRALVTDFGQWKIGEHDVELGDRIGTPDFPDRTYQQYLWDTHDALHRRFTQHAARTEAALAAIAAKVDIDPAELEAVKAAAAEGARTGVTSSSQQLAAAIADALRDDIGLTPAEAEAAAERAVRRVLGELDE
ncbi:MAG TPA: DUF1906 domain-containing protein [Candidatus Limnocylindrales bacterium]